MKYGHFDDQKKEYVITTPKTPLPWINYLGCEEFFTLISNTGGGYAFYKDAKLLRLTRYRYNNTPLDSNGHYFYIKDGDTIWNPGWQPTRTPLHCHLRREESGRCGSHGICTDGRYSGDLPCKGQEQCGCGKGAEAVFICRILSLERHGRHDELPAQLQHRRS